jgi:hypothetical protein
MRGRVVLITAALGAGCGGFPAFHGGDIGVTTEGSEGGAIVNGPGYRLQFGDGGYHFPTSLQIGGTEMLAGQPPDCTDESAMGISLHPVTRLDGSTSPLHPPKVAIFSMVWTGPLVVRVQLEWEPGGMCGGVADIGAHGISTFTLVGDRITRLDEVTTPAVVTSDACPCTGPSDKWDVTTFTGLVPDVIDELVGAVNPVDDGPGNPAGQGVCVAGEGHRLAFAWPGATSRVRHVPLAGGNRAFAVVYDMVQTPDSTFRLPAPLSTTMLVNRDESCEDLHDRAIAMAVSPDIAVNGGPLMLANDGIYGGHNKTGDVPPTATLPVTLTPAGTDPIPGGFLVWLDFGAPQPGFAIHRTPEIADREYRFQIVTSAPNQALFWFPDPLAPGEEITIEAQ